MQRWTDPKLLEEWQNTKPCYPPCPIPGKSFFYFERPDPRSLFCAELSPPKPPCPPQKATVPRGPRSFGEYLSRKCPASFISGCLLPLLLNLGLPLIVLDLVLVSHGALTAFVFLGWLAYQYSAYELGRKKRQADRKQALRAATREYNSAYISYQEELNKYRRAIAAWQEALGKNLAEAWRNFIPELKEHPRPEVGKTARPFHRALLNAGVEAVLEAVPAANPYTTRNGTYSADIGISNPEAGVLLDIEVDEKHHFTDFEQWAHDRHRNALFLRHGWSVIRFSDDAVSQHLQDCVRDVLEVIRSMQNRANSDLSELKNPEKWNPCLLGDSSSSESTL